MLHQRHPLSTAPLLCCFGGAAAEIHPRYPFPLLGPACTLMLPAQVVGGDNTHILLQQPKEGGGILPALGNRRGGRGTKPGRREQAMEGDGKKSLLAIFRRLKSDFVCNLVYCKGSKAHVPRVALSTRDCLCQRHDSQPLSGNCKCTAA